MLQSEGRARPQGGGDRGGSGGGPGRDPGPSKTLQYRDFSTGLVRAGSRSGIPDTSLWECLQAQIIGPGQILTLTDPAASIHTFAPAASSLWGVVINLGAGDVSRIIAIRSDGSAASVDPATGTATAICVAGDLSSAARVAMWRDTHVLFGDPTKGLASWDGTTFIKYPTTATFTMTTTIATTTATWTAGPVPASALVAGMTISGANLAAGTVIVAVVGTTITLSINATATGSMTATIGAAAPTSVRDLDVFEGRVWLVTGTRGIAFSGPGSFTGFETIYAGGATVLTDPVFKGEIVRIVAAMQLLWIVGASALNTLSNVQVVAGVTVFQNENLVAGIGTAFGDSVQPLFRTMIFFTPPGVYAILGATPQKLSDALDGLFRDVAGIPRSPAAVFTLNNILVYAVLVTIAGVRRLLLYSRPTWSVCAQGDDLLWITTVVRTSGDIEAWGTNGTTLRKLFGGTTGDFVVASKLFDYGAFTQRKNVRRVGVEADVTGLGVADLGLTLQNEYNQEEAAGQVVPTQVTWINGVGAPVTWINGASGPVTWIAGGRIIIQGESGFSGNLIGFKLDGEDSVPLTINAVAWEVGALGEWTFAP